MASSQLDNHVKEMSESRFFALDEALVSAIKSGANTYGALVAHGSLLADAKELAVGDRFGGYDGGRVIDRRLQAMRKSGRLEYKGRQWCVVTMSTKAEPVVLELTVRSRHLQDYLLVNRADGTAWQPVRDASVVGGATWKAVRPNPLAVLASFAEGRISHLNRGTCPDPVEGPLARDAECPVCQALAALQQI